MNDEDFIKALLFLAVMFIIICKISLIKKIYEDDEDLTNNK